MKAMCSTNAAFVAATTAVLQVTPSALSSAASIVGVKLLQDAQGRGIVCLAAAFDGSQSPRADEQQPHEAARDRVFVLSPACCRLQARGRS